MKHLKITLTLFFALCIAPLTFIATAQMAEIQKFHDTYTTSFNKGDATNLSSLYAQDATVRNSDGTIVIGLNDIKDSYDAFFSLADYSISLITKDVTILDKDYLFVNGGFHLASVDGSRPGLLGEFVNTMKKIKGQWKLFKSYRYLVTTNNASVVDGLYNAFAEGDIPAALGMMDAKIVWNEAEGNKLADGNPYIGPDAVLNGVFARLPVDFEGFKLVDIKLHEMSNNQVLATLRYNAISKHNGKKLDAQVAHLWGVKDGKAISFQQYVDTKQLDEMLQKQ